MRIIKEYISCEVQEEEYLNQSAELEESLKYYNKTYIMGKDGYVYEKVKLQNGCHIQYKTSVKLPYINGTSELKESFNFLPGGKIPFNFYSQIEQFFVDVMTGVGVEGHTGHGEYEAQAFIVWNKEVGYRIEVPIQTVSKGSVKYDIDFLQSGDMIVVDFHSHNSFGAFYSGTDDNDDKKGIRISGVLGHLNKKQPQYVLRFNYYDKKIDLQFEDVFDEDLRTIDYPKTWLAKVNIIKFHRPPQASSYRVYSPARERIGNIAAGAKKNPEIKKDQSMSYFPELPVCEFTEQGIKVLRDSYGRACKKLESGTYTLDHSVKPFRLTAGGSYEKYFGESPSKKSIEETETETGSQTQLEFMMDDFGYFQANDEANRDLPPDDLPGMDDGELTEEDLYDQYLAEDSENKKNMTILKAHVEAITEDSYLLELIQFSYLNLSKEGRERLETNGL